MERKKTSFCPIFLLIFHRCIREKWQKIDAMLNRLSPKSSGGKRNRCYNIK